MLGIEPGDTEWRVGGEGTSLSLQDILDPGKGAGVAWWPLVTRAPLEQASMLARGFEVDAPPEQFGRSRVFVGDEKDVEKLRALVLTAYEKVVRRGLAMHGGPIPGWQRACMCVLRAGSEQGEPAFGGDVAGVRGTGREQARQRRISPSNGAACFGDYAASIRVLARGWQSITMLGRLVSCGGRG